MNTRRIFAIGLTLAALLGAGGAAAASAAPTVAASAPATHYWG